MTDRRRHFTFTPDEPVGTVVRRRGPGTGSTGAAAGRAPGTRVGTYAAAPRNGTPAVPAALGLGWRMAQLRAASALPTTRRRDAVAVTDGLNLLSAYNRLVLHLDQVEFLLGAVVVSVAWTQDIPAPSTVGVRRALRPVSPDRDPRGNVLVVRELDSLHDELLVKLSGAGTQLGKAYGLGFTLADTCRDDEGPGQADKRGKLERTFGRDHLRFLYTGLTDLASVLPDHSAKPVRASLAAWRDVAREHGCWVTPPPGVRPVDGHGDISDDDTVVDTSPGGTPGAPPPSGSGMAGTLAGLGRRVAVLSGGERTTPVPPDTRQVTAPEFTAAFQRQGEVWRTVLTGEKAARDMLSAEEYVVAGANTFRSGWQTSKKLMRAFLWPLLGVAACVIGIVLAIIVLQASGGTKIGGLLGTFVALLLAGWRFAGPRVAPVAKELEGPLWGAELDIVVTQGLTIAPVGTANVDGWVEFLADAFSPEVSTAPLRGPDRPDAAAGGYP